MWVICVISGHFYFHRFWVRALLANCFLCLFSFLSVCLNLYGIGFHIDFKFPGVAGFCYQIQ